jgi:hypothetical protein
MPPRSLPVLALCLAAAGAPALLPACSSPPDAETTVGSMSAFGLETARVRDAIDEALRALDALATTAPGELDAACERYAGSVEALGRQAELVRRRAEEMRARGDDFFARWDDADGSSPERRARLNAAYEEIEAETTAARDEFVPFQRSLEDVATYVERDRSLAGVRATAGHARRAKADGARVKSRIDAVLVQLNAVRGMIPAKP